MGTFKIPSDTYIYLTGNISEILMLHEKYITMLPGETIKINATIYVPSNAKSGVYTGKLMIYGRPEWDILPIHRHLIPTLVTQGISYLGAVITSDAVTNFVIAFGLIVFQLIFIAISNLLALTLIWNYENSEYRLWKIKYITDAFSSLFNRVSSRFKKSRISGMFGEISSHALKFIPFCFAIGLTSVMGLKGVILGLVLSFIPSIIYVLTLKNRAYIQDVIALAFISAISISAGYSLHLALLNNNHSIIEVLWCIFAFLSPIPYITLLLFPIILALSIPSILIGKMKSKNRGEYVKWLH